MKFFTDILQLEDKWSLSRTLLIIMFITMMTAWLTNWAVIGTGMITIFGMILSYSFVDKVQKNFEKIAHKKIEADESLMIVD